MTDEGWGSGVAGGLLVIAEVKNASDSFRWVSDL